MIIHLDSLLHYEMKLNKENNKIELYVLPEDACPHFNPNNDSSKLIPELVCSWNKESKVKFIGLPWVVSLVIPDNKIKPGLWCGDDFCAMIRCPNEAWTKLINFK